eukprot:comp18086_c0_seq1/m.18706 comp18086_c0_seq1/g.18706  ORF comp18086_c0_seq1/g.18706 comp18086_c0_seq1/m.18706 type:complete len:470 (-) comp18086_c0_seq1:385-1794(-)
MAPEATRSLMSARQARRPAPIPLGKSRLQRPARVQAVKSSLSTPPLVDVNPSGPLAPLNHVVSGHPNIHTSHATQGNVATHAPSASTSPAPTVALNDVAVSEESHRILSQTQHAPLNVLRTSSSQYRSTTGNTSHFPVNPEVLGLDFEPAGFIKGRLIVAKNPIGYTAYYGGYDCVTGRRVSVQVVKKEQRASFFRTEAQANCRLQGVDGVMRTLEVVEQGEHLFIIKEQCWQDLHTYIRNNKRMGEEHAREVFSQVVRSVAECHSRKYILRDLKLNGICYRTSSCTNVLITALDTLSGQAEVTEPGPDPKSTPSYCAPELLSGGKYSEKSDMWSLGIILYSCLHGSYPFMDENPECLNAKILSGQYHLSSALSPSARNLIQALLSTDPSSRPPAHIVMMHPWVRRAETNTQNSNYSYSTGAPQQLGGLLDHGGVLSAATAAWRLASGVSGGKGKRLGEEETEQEVPNM